MVTLPRAHRRQETASWRVRYVAQERLHTLPRRKLTPYITVLSAPCTPYVLPPNSLPASQHAMNSIASHPSVQSAKDTVVNGEVSAVSASVALWRIANMGFAIDFRFRTFDPILNCIGPIGQNVSAEAGKTRNEFADLANSRQIPDHKAATGQNLTRTHIRSRYYYSN